jgi:hypothetical protein
VSMSMLPARAGTCAHCASVHTPDFPHNYWSLFYQMRFRMQYGRDATHADATAHCDPDMISRYRIALSSVANLAWNSPPDCEPIAEPYVLSDGLQIIQQPIEVEVRHV